MRAIFVVGLLSLAGACSEVRQHLGDAQGGEAPRSTGTGGAAGASRTASSPQSTAPSWQWAGPGPTGAALYGAWVLSAQDAWFVGDFGTVLHWDGRAFKSVATGATADDSLRSVWASSPDDVWIGGVGRLLHFDGAAWSSAFSFPTSSVNGCDRYGGGDVRAISVIWGDGPKNVWFVCDHAATRWDGSRFYAAAGFAGHIHWLAGFESNIPGADDAGKVYWADGWTSLWTSRFDGDAYAFTETIPLGICDNCMIAATWGASANDIWAITDDAMTASFRHYDGVSVGIAKSVFSGGVRKQAQLSGIDETRIHAIANDTAWSFNGATWEVDTHFPIAPDQVRLSGGNGELFALGSAGEMFRLDPATADWMNLAPGIRDDLIAVSAVNDETAWAISKRAIFRWHAEAWSLAPVIEPTADLVSLWAASPKRLWVSTATSVLSCDPAGCAVSLKADDAQLWGFSENDVWAASKALHHWDGTKWSRIETHHSHFTSIGGSRPDAMWLLAKEDDVCIAYAFDGKSLKRMPADPPGQAVSCDKQWSSGRDDLWLAGVPGVRWDGSAWASLGTSSVRAIWGTAKNDVWIEDGGMLRHFDGTQLASEWRGPGGISALSGTSRESAWAVGKAGAALRYRPFSTKGAE